MKFTSNETKISETKKRDIFFDWSAFITFLLETPGEREKIGPAWFLFTDIAHHADRAGIYADTYSRLSQKYSVAKVTVKTWRQYLRQHGVIESYSRGHSVAFRLLDPYLSYLKPIVHEKTEQTESIEDLLALKKLLLKTVSGEAVKTPA